MAVSIDIDSDIVRPGDILRFEYEIITDNATIANAAIKRVKDNVWSHPMLNYQGSKVYSVGDMERKRDVKILHVYASVREFEKNTRVKVQEAGLYHYGVIAAGLIAGLAVAMVVKAVIKETGVTTQRMAAAFEDTWKGVAVLLLLVLWFVKG